MNKQILIGSLCFMAGLVSAVGITSFAQQKGLEFRAETGNCNYGRSPDGMFYQSTQQTNNQLKPGCSAFSIAGLFDDVNGWRIGFHDFGTIRARDNRFMRRDDEIRATTGPCDPATLSGCKGTMYGEGGMKGVSFSYTRRFPIKGIDVLGELGMLFFESDFHAWASKDEAPGTLYATEKSSIFNRPDLVMGAGVRWKDFYVMGRKYTSLGHRAQSLTDNSVFEVTAGIAFPANF